jgi:hypothetical protein
MDDALRVDSSRPRGPVDARRILWHLTATPSPHRGPGPAILSAGTGRRADPSGQARPRAPESQVQDVHGLDVRRAGGEDDSMVTH